MSSAKPSVVDVVMVVRDAARALACTLDRLPTRDLRSIVVVDNGSADNSSLIARDRGAIVLREPGGGYGAGCMRAIRHLQTLPIPPDVVVFIDPLSSEDPAELGVLLSAFQQKRAELALAVVSSGSRTRALVDASMVALIRVLYGQSFRGLSSFRAVRFSALVALGLSAHGDGWNVEMLVKSVRLGLDVVEVSVSTIEKPPRISSRSYCVATGQKVLRIWRHAVVR